MKTQTPRRHYKGTRLCRYCRAKVRLNRKHVYIEENGRYIHFCSDAHHIAYMNPPGSPVAKPVVVTWGLYRYGGAYSIYGDPLPCRDGVVIEVKESGTMNRPTVSVSLDRSKKAARGNLFGAGSITCRLDSGEARALIARLQAWLDEIPAVWGKP